MKTAFSAAEKGADTPSQHDSSASQVNVTSTGMARALAALHGPLQPLSADDLAERRTLIAREYARRDARLNPPMQLSLDEAA